MERDLEITMFGTATLGSVIDALRAAENDATVYFDFCGMRPTSVKSYRGYYDHLAIGWSEDDFAYAWELALHLEQSVGAKFSGYKGGEYTMTRDTPLWVDKWGDGTGTGIVGIEYLGEHSVVLKTDKVD